MVKKGLLVVGFPELLSQKLLGSPCKRQLSANAQITMDKRCVSFAPHDYLDVHCLLGKTEVLGEFEALTRRHMDQRLIMRAAHESGDLSPVLFISMQGNNLVSTTAHVSGCDYAEVSTGQDCTQCIAHDDSRRFAFQWDDNASDVVITFK